MQREAIKYLICIEKYASWARKCQFFILSYFRKRRRLNLNNYITVNFDTVSIK